jgi:AcrR family transcriptional regulator
MPVEDRRAMIIDAVIPLILKHGSNLTSRQIAEEAEIAEGTIFRAFGDKDSLIRAAVEKYFDPLPMRARMAGIDSEAPMRDKVRSVIEILQSRFSGVFSMMSALGQTARPPFQDDKSRTEYARIIADLLRPEIEQLNVLPEHVGPLIRLVAFATALPPLNETITFSIDELTDFVLYGIAGEPKTTEKDN